MQVLPEFLDWPGNPIQYWCMQTTADIYTGSLTGFLLDDRVKQLDAHATVLFAHLVVSEQSFFTRMQIKEVCIKVNLKNNNRTIKKSLDKLKEFKLLVEFKSAKQKGFLVQEDFAKPSSHAHAQIAESAKTQVSDSEKTAIAESAKTALNASQSAFCAEIALSTNSRARLSISNKTSNSKNLKDLKATSANEIRGKIAQNANAEESFQELVNRLQQKSNEMHEFIAQAPEASELPTESFLFRRDTLQAPAIKNAPRAITAPPVMPEKETPKKLINKAVKRPKRVEITKQVFRFIDEKLKELKCYKLPHEINLLYSVANCDIEVFNQAYAATVDAVKSKRVKTTVGAFIYSTIKKIAAKMAA